MPIKRKINKKAACLNLHNQVLFIGGNAYQLKKVRNLKKSVGEGLISVPEDMFGTKSVPKMTE